MPSKSQSTFSRSRACLAIQNLSATTATALPLTSGYSKTSRWQPAVELELQHLLSVDQVEAILSGRLDAGFGASLTPWHKDLAHWEFAQDRMVFAVPKGHALTKRKTVRLRDLRCVPFVWFPRWVNPTFYDRMMQACTRGGLSAPRIVQEAPDRDTNLGLVQCRIGLSWQPETVRWHCPRGIVLLPVVDMDVRLPFNLIWKKDNSSPLLQRFVAQVETLGRKKSMRTDAIKKSRHRDSLRACTPKPS